MASSISGDELRWGILGCGKISGDFTQALTHYSREKNRIVGVASADSPERAEKFIQHYQLREHLGNKDGTAAVVGYGSYAELFADPRVEVVYVGVLNHQHKAAVLGALSAGKHVLCEKPMGVNAKEVREMVALSRSKRLFLMEAFWSRFFPAWQLLHGNAIGEERLLSVIGEADCVVADFGYALHPAHKMELDKGGGCLLATSCYLPMLASWAFRTYTTDGRAVIPRPTKVIATGGVCAEKGTDQWASFTLEYTYCGDENQPCSKKKQASLFYTGVSNTPGSASIGGPGGWIQMPHNFFVATELWTKERADKEGSVKKLHFPLPDRRLEKTGASTDKGLQPLEWNFSQVHSPGLSYEADHVYQCIKREGRLESGVMPLDESIILAEISDEIRHQLGVKFKQDR